MEGMKRYRISFSGRNYPDYRPASVVMFSQDTATVDKWVEKQLATWQIDPKEVKYVVKEEPKQEEAPKTEAKPRKEGGRQRHTRRPKEG